MAKNTMLQVGKWLFAIGLIIGILMGIVPLGDYSGIGVSLLVLIGLVIGFLNISAKESTPFMLAAVVLVIVAGFGSAALSNVQYIGTYMRNILQYFLMIVVPATIIVSLKELYVFAERK